MGHRKPTRIHWKADSPKNYYEMKLFSIINRKRIVLSNKKKLRKYSVVFFKHFPKRRLLKDPIGSFFISILWVFSVPRAHWGLNWLFWQCIFFFLNIFILKKRVHTKKFGRTLFLIKTKLNARIISIFKG